MTFWTWKATAQRLARRAAMTRPHTRRPTSVFWDSMAHGRKPVDYWTPRWRPWTPWAHGPTPCVTLPASLWRGSTSGPRGKFGNAQPQHKRCGQGARAQDWPSPIQASATWPTSNTPSVSAEHVAELCALGAQVLLVVGVAAGLYRQTLSHLDPQI